MHAVQKIMGKLLAGAVCASVLGVAPALAQADAATVKAATALIDLQNPPARLTGEVNSRIKQMRDGAAVRALLNQNPQIKMELAKNQPSATAGIARVGAVQADTMAPILRDMQTAGRQAGIDAYAKRFTAQELEAILAFYRSPAGAKLMREQRAIAEEVGRTVQPKFAPRLQAAEKTVTAKLQEELPKMFPQLAAPPK